MFKDAQTIDALIAQLIGFGSKCWDSNGVFDSELASKATDAGIARMKELLNG